MRPSDPRELLQLTDDVQTALIAGARDTAPVRGLTHGYYKYPARFSPAFASAAICAFTKPGDLVLDPHVGGGTTLVEAIAAGRRAVGVDISTLAEFVTKVKTTVFSIDELGVLVRWCNGICTAIDMRRPSIPFAEYQALGYYKHLNHPSRWRLRKAIEQSLAYAVALREPHLEAFGRCAILRTAQWALDGRRKQSTVAEFRLMLQHYANDMIVGARDLHKAVNETERHSAIVLHRSAAGLENERVLEALSAPSLVVTSPPYPGVHVLYHRWQVDGRKETPLPFMIANRLDGAGSSYYTMGDRKNPGLRTYFESIEASMSSIAAIADENTIIVQMVAFSAPDWQLPLYIETMQRTGLRELFLPSLSTEADGRLWRSVPGRRWYSDQRGETPASKEVVLFHRKSSRITPPSAVFVGVSNIAEQ